MVIEMNSEKSRILDLLEQGRITVDEAVMLLEALGEKNAKEMTKRYRRGDKKNDFDEKASKIVDEIGKKINYFIENLGQYFSKESKGQETLQALLQGSAGLNGTSGALSEMEQRWRLEPTVRWTLEV